VLFNLLFEPARKNAEPKQSDRKDHSADQRGNGFHQQENREHHANSQIRNHGCSSAQCASLDIGSLYN
jgi:hypothetical protein